MKDRIRTMPTEVSVYYQGESPIFGERTIKVALDDEAAGAYVIIRSEFERREDGGIAIDMPMLEAVTKVAREMIRRHDSDTGE